MKKINGGVLILSLFMIGGVVFAGGGKKTQKEPEAQKEVLVMGTNAAFPPFESVGDNDEIIGFDVEIARAIAEKMGRELKTEDMKFDGLLAAVNSGKIDLAIAGMTITDKRKEEVDFSDPYFEAAQAILIQKGGEAPGSVNNIAGKEVGVQLGTTGEEIASSLVEAPVAFQAAFEAVLDLKNGKLDLVVIDLAPAKVFAAKNDDIELVELSDFPIEYYGIAVKKGNPEFLKMINETLAELRSSGRYDELLAEWFGE